MLSLKFELLEGQVHHNSGTRKQAYPINENFEHFQFNLILCIVLNGTTVA